MNIITAAQTKDADRHTIETEPIASVDLMERAANAFVTAFIPLYPDSNTSILICCGTGNNGGDGLAIARLLQAHGYDAITVWVVRFANSERDDFTANFARLHNTPIRITEFFPGDKLPDIDQTVIIDALLGSGLNKPLTGDWLRLVKHINGVPGRKVAVDVPTGLRADGIIPDTEYALYAHDVISFQRPKLSFFFPESAKAIERFHVVDIGLDESYIERLPTDFRLITRDDIQRIYRNRLPFSHKGTYGHALLIAGNTRTMGAALLCCGASVYSGAGLTSACIPPAGLAALNTCHPEVMYCPEEDLAEIWGTFDAVGIGPGLGQREKLLTACLGYSAKPMVIDADAITLLAREPSLMEKLPTPCILTPHMKEFDRLFGTHSSWWDRLRTAREQAEARHIVLVLKNRYTFIVMPDGSVYINPTGNPAMASGGMGDVLTGMLTSFLAQGYPPQEAAILACYLHGTAGDQLAANGMAVVPAGKLIRMIPLAIGNRGGFS
ncbi:NAD(P)H-hydrate epimerase [Parapedobacter luteus]|uniref:Bifunctional NAD(P)H-hydrate repair enzyme n=1 Tax=Parapedobacter luteus TaxID=623280 RepID=A0A1T5A4M8_9SPHI|nr:NAD(P)H-hydrate dehydratase [Parapedobacter luteus]SKB29944.1 NAD(P)H-hydrate epimerase [Parapedobacter luteus]